MTKRIRTLTVSRLYREWGEPHHKGECVVPSIRLNGRWLAALGFEPGQKIRVTTNGATLTLAPITFESDSELRLRTSSMTKGQYSRAISTR